MTKVLALLLIMFSTPFSAVTACELSMQAQHYPPRFIKHTSIDGAAQWQGFNAELFYLLSEASGCTGKIVEVPWGRALQLLAAGEIDVMSNMSRNAEREGFAHFVGPHQQEQILVLSNSREFDQLHSLDALLQSRQPVSVMQGIYYGEQFEQALAQQAEWANRLVYVSTSQQKLEMFIAGRVAYTFEDSINLQQLYNDGVLNRQQHKPLFSLHTNPVYFAFSKQSVSKEQLQRLQQAWHQLQNDGIVDKLKQRYFAADNAQ